MFLEKDSERLFHLSDPLEKMPTWEANLAVFPPHLSSGAASPEAEPEESSGIR
jgi:hypothetical protein